jgi:hypothetical protein
MDDVDEKPRGPNLAIILGVVGTAAVLIVVLIATLSGGEVPEDPNGTPMAHETPEPAPPAPKQKTLAERTLDLKLAVLAAGEEKDLSRLKKLHADASLLPTKDVSKLAVETALKVDRQAAWAREALGFVRYTGEAIPGEDDFVMYPTPDYKILLAAKKECWVTAERLAELKEAEARFLEHQRKVETDAHYRKVCHYRGMVALHPIFASWEYTTVECRPYLVFVQKSSDPMKAAKLGERSREKAAIFRRLYDTFLETFGEGYDLPRLESDVYENDVILRAWVFADRASFDRYHRSIGKPMGKNVGAYYSPQDQWMIIPEGVGGGMKVPGQDMDTNVTVHEGTHQLIHCFTKMIVEKESGEELVWTDRRLSSKSHWFQEGMAEYFGSVVKKGSTWNLFQPNLYRLMGWKRFRARGGKDWALSDLLHVKNSRELRAQRDQNRCPQFYGQAWAFVSFCMNDDRYRKKMLAYMSEEFHARSGFKVFKKIFGTEGEPGSQLEKDYLAHCKRLLEGR